MKYEKAVATIVEFDNSDVVTASVCLSGYSGVDTCNKTLTSTDCNGIWDSVDCNKVTTEKVEINCTSFF